MKVLIVDDEIGAVEMLTRRVREAAGESTTVYTAHNGREALDIVTNNNIDVMFLDVEMPGMSGLEVARQSKAERPKTNIVLCTAYEQYALNAWQLFISGYLVKPASTEQVKNALSHLRIPVVEQLRVQCFGHFEVFYRDTVVTFKRSGAKEMFAYLVSLRGTSVTSGELCELLRTEPVNPDLKKASVRKYAMEIRNTLFGIGFEDVLHHTRDSYSIVPARLDCDFYRYLDGDADARSLYGGEFMCQYSWAEPMNGRLEAIRQRE